MENKLFNENIKAKDKQEFKKWILKNYFSDNSTKWYEKSVDESNVLDFVSNNVNFPQTPCRLVNLWNLKQSLKKYSKGKEKIEEEREMKYTIGDETLKNIGKEIGNVTPTMVTKFYSSGIKKVKFTTNNKSIEEMNVEELDDLNFKIMTIRIEAAKEYSEILNKNSGKISDIIKQLIANQYITKNEASLISEEEIIELIKLSTKTKEEICLFLHTDIERDNNIFKTFQSIVSKKFYKNRKFI